MYTYVINCVSLDPSSHLIAEPYSNCSAIFDGTIIDGKKVSFPLHGEKCQLCKYLRTAVFT